MQLIAINRLTALIMVLLVFLFKAAETLYFGLFKDFFIYTHAPKYIL